MIARDLQRFKSRNSKDFLIIFNSDFRAFKAFLDFKIFQKISKIISKDLQRF